MSAECDQAERKRRRRREYYERLKADPVRWAAHLEQTRIRRAERYPNDPGMRARNVAAVNAWRKNNPEKAKALKKRYYQNNREKMLSQKREQRIRQNSMRCPAAQLLTPEERIQGKKRRRLERQRRWMSKNWEDIRDTWIAKAIIRDVTGLPVADMPQELVEAKALQLRLRRAVRESLDT